jgi:hypothetical protein
LLSGLAKVALGELDRQHGDLGFEVHDGDAERALREQ